MSKNLDDVLYRFSDSGDGFKAAVLTRVLQQADSPVKPAFRYRKYVIAAACLCLVVVITGFMPAIAGSISKFIRTLRPAENVIMNEVEENMLVEIVDAWIAGDLSALKDGTIAHQVLVKLAETPCYIYVFYYRGYTKLIVLDEDTDNLGEVNEWLKDNGGIVAMVTDTPEEAAKYRDLSAAAGARDIPLAELKTVMDGCTLPEYLPDGVYDYLTSVQYNEQLSSANVTYAYGGNSYISLDIRDAAVTFNKNFIANLAVTSRVEISQINRHDVYISDGYYVWQADGFVYVLYSAGLPREECIMIIESINK